MKKPNDISVPGGYTKVLLHTCCAPCSSAIIEKLLHSGITPVVYYYNPNIYPEEEYLIRKRECIRYCQETGVEFVDADYDHSSWRCHVKGMENEPERGGRCLECFKLRLLQTAAYASTHDLHVVATTLASSRWKSLDQINAAGEWACSGFEGVDFWAANWRKGGLQERRNALIKEKNFYNQLYCGCEFSLEAMQKKESALNGTSNNKTL
jgi:hypothetical protein